MTERLLLHPDAVKFVNDLTEWGRPLTENDDLDFWKVSVSVLMRDACCVIGQHSSGRDFYIEIGVCSHWLRPHQTRWTDNGGFAWPSGYNAVGHSRTGLPAFDWSGYLQWYPKAKIWRMVRRDLVPPKRKFVLRATLPARTVKHNQGVVNAVWIFGTPQARRKKPMTFYGFRKMGEEWMLFAWRELDGEQWK